jgi:hypothetical protein
VWCLQYQQGLHILDNREDGLDGMIVIPPIRLHTSGVCLSNFYNRYGSYSCVAEYMVVPDADLAIDYWGQSSLAFIFISK